MKVRQGTVTTGDVTKNVVSVLVMSDYAEKTLSVVASRKAYVPEQQTAPTPSLLSNMDVNLTLRHSDDLAKTDAETSSLYGTEQTDGKGKATFTLLGDLTVTKALGEDTPDTGETFYVHVQSGDERRTLPLKTGGTGTAVQLPFGEYTVKEDTKWAWRYQPSYGSAATDSATGTLSSYQMAQTVTITNQLANSNWFTAEQTKHNVFWGGESGGDTP